MTSSNAQHPSRLELVDKVPLVNSFWINKPVELPQDIHPLPANVADYFVYPYALEQHALTVLPDTIRQMREAQTRRQALLQTIADEKERARKAKLNALAPGWSEGTVMQPTKRSSVPATHQAPPSTEQSTMSDAPRDQMQDLVEGLEALDSKVSNSQQQQTLID